MSAVQATIPSLLVAKKIERPLFIVLDDTRVKDSWQLSSNAMSGGTLKDFQLLVSRDIKGALEPYFSKVTVVKSRDGLPNTPHIVADVKVDRLKLHDMVAGALTYVLIEITWSFALRPSEADDYVFSFAGTASSSESYPTFEVGLAQMVESAVTGMLKKWTESEGIEKLRTLPGPIERPKPPTPPKHEGGHA